MAGTSGRGEVKRKGVRRVNMVQRCVHMYVDAEMVPVETIPEIGGGENKRKWWRG
jgi:hypothetical protein